MTRPDSSELLTVTRRDGVVTLTLDRAERKNALTVEMVSRLTEEVEAAGRNEGDRVILIQAAGADFCSGIDLVESNRPGRGADEGATEGGDRPARPRAGHLQRNLAVGAHRMIQTITSVQLPVVAAVRGWAAGVGNALALSADVTVASDTARFWVPFVTKGFTPDSGNSWLIPRLVGLARAKEMILRGCPVDGRTAAEWGLVNTCVDDADLDETAGRTAEEFAGMATVAIGLTKALLHTNLESGLAVAMQNEAIYEELGVRSDDFKEGIRSFAEKRPPRFTGR
ncbi:MAG TPA: enoyl-CoA hydratase-related protein [Acidimicrobiales bacterium]|nr:enoyl-CoA hydratase-related protein [Acidimicrobiales bacterium]